MSDSIRGTALILTNGMLDDIHGKTAHGLLRGSERFEPLAVIDHALAGRDAGEVLDGRHRGIPVFASIDDYFADPQRPKPDYCLIGVALAGGQLPDAFRTLLRQALQRDMSVVNGLHTFISDDPELRALAQERNLLIYDIRKPRPRSALRFWTGEIFTVKAPRIAVLGTDCALGKRTTARFLTEACRADGLRAEMIFTGQTGWMQGSPYGFIFDSTVNDFIGGEIERVLVTCDREAKPDVIFIEGQSSLRNPSGPCGSEFLLSGQAKGVVLMHAPGRSCYDGTEVTISSLASEIGLIELYGSKVLAVCLNEEGMAEEELQHIQEYLQIDLQLPVIRPLKEGVSALLPVIRTFLEQSSRLSV